MTSSSRSISRRSSNFLFNFFQLPQAEAAAVS